MGKQAKKKQARKEDPSLDKSLEEALDELTPEQAEMFVRALNLAMKKRKLMLVGYLSAAFAMVIGILWAFYMFGTHTKGTFIGWVFLIPFGTAGTLLYVFGAMAKRVGRQSKQLADKNE